MKESEKKSEFLKTQEVYVWGLVPRKFRYELTYKQELLKHTWESQKGLFMYGDVGTGKSTFLHNFYFDKCLKILIDYEALDHADIKKDNQIIYFSSFVISLQTNFDTAEQRINTLAEVKNLYIDDLGAEKCTDYVKQMLYTLINQREMNCLNTYIASNLSLDQIDKYYDPRISSRIAGMCEIVKFTGGDKRLKGKHGS